LALVLDPVEHLAPLLVVGDVADEGADVPAGKFVGQLVARGLECVAAACDHQYGGAEAEQFARDRATDAGAAAGDQGKLSVEAPAMRIHVAFRGAVATSIAAAGLGSHARGLVEDDEDHQVLVAALAQAVAVAGAGEDGIAGADLAPVAV